MTELLLEGGARGGGKTTRLAELRAHAIARKLGIVSPFVWGHLVDGILSRFPHFCPGDGCAVERYLKARGWRRSVDHAD